MTTACVTYLEETFLEDVSSGDVRLELGLSERSLTTDQLLARGQLDELTLPVVDRSVGRSDLAVALISVDERI